MFKMGLIVGRFQTFHKGHEQIIREAMSVADQILVFIGSAQESNTNKNPFSYEMRKKILYSVFKNEVESGKMIIVPLNDLGVGNNKNWGMYVLDQAMQAVGTYPDILISGKEERRISWFDCADGTQYPQIAELYLSKTIEISGTELRDIIVRDDKETWKNFVSPNVWPLYNEMRTIVIKSKNNMTTTSL